MVKHHTSETTRYRYKTVHHSTLSMQHVGTVDAEQIVDWRLNTFKNNREKLSRYQRIIRCIYHYRRWWHQFTRSVQKARLVYDQHVLQVGLIDHFADCKMSLFVWRKKKK